MIKLRKFITISLLSFLLLGSVVGTAYAQESPKLDTRTGWQKLIEKVGKFTDSIGENISQFIGKQIYGALETTTMEVCPTCTVGGERVMNDPNIPESAKMGLLETSEKAVYTMFNSFPDVDVTDHLASQWVPGYADSSSTYAGGYEDLRTSKVDVLWTATRDIAYIGFVLVMIVIGFMIMFRHKIGGQMMVTVGNAIPKVIVALVLVTFSFAIIGLIIDLGGFIMRLVEVLLYGDAGEGINVTNPKQMMSGFFDKNAVFKLGGPSENVGTLVFSILAIFGIGGVIVVGITSLLLTLIIIGILFVGMVKLWLTLLKAYLGIIINVIVAPLAIFAGALPGNEASTINIFKSTLRNVLVFPIAYTIVNLPYYADFKGLSLMFPATLTGEGAANLEVGNFILAVVKIVAIYAASSAPAIAATLIPPTASKQAGDAATSIKASLSGVPFIGGMFK